jgi:rRNA processing protein Gar1
MKYINKFEDYTIDEIFNWWSGIRIYDTDDYYMIGLNDMYLRNKIIQLKSGLIGKVVKFFSKEYNSFIEAKIENVELNSNDSYINDELYFKVKGNKNQNNIHVVDTEYAIGISKLHVMANKYNL